MADLNDLKQLLVAADLDLSRFEMRSSRELRVSCAAGEAHALG